MENKLLEEALMRLTEINSIVTNGDLSGKGKMTAISDLLAEYSFADSCHNQGEEYTSEDLHFGKSRVKVSLNGLVGAKKVTVMSNINN